MTGYVRILTSAATTTVSIGIETHGTYGQMDIHFVVALFVALFVVVFVILDVIIIDSIIIFRGRRELAVIITVSKFQYRFYRAIRMFFVRNSFMGRCPATGSLSSC
jgi:hypothetical protein